MKLNVLSAYHSRTLLIVVALVSWSVGRRFGAEQLVDRHIDRLRLVAS